MKLSHWAHIRTGLVFREQSPREDAGGNVRALAIKDLVANKPLHWRDLPRVTVEDRHLGHCLQPGEVVIPSRGDYYRAWLFEEAPEPVLPIGQLNVITPKNGLNNRYLVWYLNRHPTQAQISGMLAGTSIKALTKTALLTLEVDVPPPTRQQIIADLDHTTERIAAIRHRLNELDACEIAHLTQQLLHTGGGHA